MARKGKRSNKHRRPKREALDVARNCFAGKWQIAQWQPDRIVLQNQIAATTTYDDGWKECINLCHLTSTLKISNDRAKTNLDRSVRWDCVQAVWKYCNRIGSPSALQSPAAVYFFWIYSNVGVPNVFFSKIIPKIAKSHTPLVARQKTQVPLDSP